MNRPHIPRESPPSVAVVLVVLFVVVGAALGVVALVAQWGRG
jgi:hypothetical protein